MTIDLFVDGVYYIDFCSATEAQASAANQLEEVIKTLSLECRLEIKGRLNMLGEVITNSTPLPDDEEILRLLEHTLNAAKKLAEDSNNQKLTDEQKTELWGVLEDQAAIMSIEDLRQYFADSESEKYTLAMYNDLKSTLNPTEEDDSERDRRF